MFLYDTAHRYLKRDYQFVVKLEEISWIRANLSLKSFGNPRSYSYTRFIIIDIKLRLLVANQTYTKMLHCQTILFPQFPENPCLVLVVTFKINFKYLRCYSYSYCLKFLSAMLIYIKVGLSRLRKFFPN